MLTIARPTRVRLAVLGLFCALWLVAGGSAFAQQTTSAPATIYTDIIIPDATPPGQTFDKQAEYFAEGKVTDLSQYLGILYNFLISIAGLVASVMMIVGGFQYLTSAGDAGRIGAAKTRMTNAFMGLILVLGAYTILTTINPALLVFKPLAMAGVKTEVALLPYCEDIKVPVRPFGNGTSCGFAGEYAVGNDKAICIYAGNCRFNPVNATDGDTIGYQTCVQRAAVSEPVGMKEELAKDPNTKFGECLMCPDLTFNRARSMGYNLDQACQAWMVSFTKVPDEMKYYERDGVTVKKGFFHYCYPRKTRSGCTGAALKCYDITRDDDTAGDDQGYVATGCEGYDEDPTLWYASNLDASGFAGGSYQPLNPEDAPDQLVNLCTSNPCQAYIDPKTGLQPFKWGCRGSNGKVYAIYRAVRHGPSSASGIDDCRNNSAPKTP